MSKWKRFLLLGSIGVVLLAGLIFTSNTKVSTAFANGCNTVAQGLDFSNDIPTWGNNCTVSETENAHSNAVYAIQSIITYAGFPNPQANNLCTAGTPDGEFGQETFDGVECFQLYWNTTGSNKISVDGIVGPQTWSALAEYINLVNLQFDTDGVWNYAFSTGSATNNFRAWGQSPYKWYVHAGGCWRQMAVNSTACE